MIMKKHTLAMVLVCILLSFSMIACSQQPSNTVVNTNDQPLAPDFTVYDASGNPVRLSDFRGTPVVLNFWASWCPPCKAEMPDFQKEFEAQGQNVQFLIVNMTDGERETVDTASAYIAQQGYTFPVYFDTKYAAANAYQVRSIPATYFIDAEGYVVAQASGSIDSKTLQQGISLIWEEN